jgi:CheY-like chemotaxis protein
MGFAESWGMTASAADILIAATDLDDRLLECLADCRATFVRTFEEAQRALREHLFKMIVVDLNFDNVRMFDLLQHVRSLADFNGVPVLCVQGSEAGAGISAALDRLVRKLGGEAFVDLRGDDEVSERREARRRRALCVLVIDHDVDAAQRLGEIVEQTGHDVDFAYDGTAGIDAARRLRPDVVFVDLALPQSDGYQVARRLRREPGLRDVRVIALTAGSNGDDGQRLREAGFDQDVVKPADRRSVQKLLEASLLQPAR